MERTKDALAKIDEITRHTPGVAHALTVAGFSFVQGANGSNFGSMFIILDPFEKRRRPELKDQAIMARLRPEWARQVKDAQVLAFGAPPIPGLSVAGGFKIMVEDRAGLGLATLQRQTDELVRKLQQQRTLVGVSTQFRSTTPQLFMDIDRTKVASLGIPLDDVNQTLEIYLGSLYVTNFNAFGRHWQVNVQAAGGFRDRVDDVNLLKVRNNQGDMVPLGALGNMHEIGGPIFVNRYNLYTAASISGSLRPGVSSGEVIKSVDKLADDTLSLSMNKEWTELMFMQIRAGDTTLYVFALAVACVFLALAALYESWSLPLAVILVVPLCLLCSVVGVLWTKKLREHLRPDRPCSAGRAGVQKFDLDRRVRQAAARAGTIASRRHARGLAPAPAADLDDLLRLHLRRHAAGRSQRGRDRKCAARWERPSSAACSA